MEQNAIIPIVITFVLVGFLLSVGALLVSNFTTVSAQHLATTDTNLTFINNVTTLTQPWCTAITDVVIP